MTSSIDTSLTINYKPDLRLWGTVFPDYWTIEWLYRGKGWAGGRWWAGCYCILRSRQQGAMAASI